MAESKIPGRGINYIAESVQVFSDGVNQTKVVNLPYHDGYIPCSIMAITASGTYEGVTLIYDYKLVNYATTKPQIKVSWTSVLSAGKGAIFNILYMQV